MNNEKSSVLFLMEIIIVILFFAICASICIRAFAGADEMSRNADRLNMAVLRAESTAELWNAGKICDDGESKEIIYDKEWNETLDTSKEKYKLTITKVQSSGSMEYCSIYIKEKEEDIYSLNIGRYNME